MGVDFAATIVYNIAYKKERPTFRYEEDMMMDTSNQNQRIVEELVARARAAQKIAEGYSQRRVDELAAALVYTLSRPELA